MSEPNRKRLSGRARARHLRTGGQCSCPYCRGDVQEVDYQGLEANEDGEVTQEARCGRCGRRWLDVFRLADVRELAS